jgi:hypothetical protein
MVLNINGFYNNLIKQLEFMVEEGFLKEEHLSNLIVRDNPDRLIDHMFSSDIHHNSKWDTK